MIGRGVFGRQIIDSFGLAVDQEDLSRGFIAKEESTAIAEPNGIPPVIRKTLVGFGIEGIDKDPRVPAGALDSTPTGEARSIARPGPGDKHSILFGQRR